MIYPLVRELADAGAPVRVPVAVTCRVLKIAKQPFYFERIGLAVRVLVSGRDAGITDRGHTSA